MKGPAGIWPGLTWSLRAGWLVAALLWACLAQPPPGAPAPLAAPSLPDLSVSVLRVVGALAVVLAVFFGGVWLFRNWQRVTTRSGGPPKLTVLEVKTLGQRHALYVVGYERERLLLAASPGGVTLVSHLPATQQEPAAPAAESVPGSSFAQTLQAIRERLS